MHQKEYAHFQLWTIVLLWAADKEQKMKESSVSRQQYKLVKYTNCCISLAAYLTMKFMILISSGGLNI